MFSVGDYVVHSNSGICLVSEITKMNVSGGEKDRKYYLLIPLHEKGSKIYMPVDQTVIPLRRAMTGEEAWKLIREIKEIEELWVDNDKLRETRYKEAIRSCDCTELIKMIKALYIRKKQRLSEGKKNTATDEHYFKLAEENLYNELSFAIGKDRSEIQDLIAASVGAPEDALTQA